MAADSKTVLVLGEAQEREILAARGCISCQSLLPHGRDCPMVRAGGSGYLGQFLISGLAGQGWRVGFTHNSTAQPKFAGDVRGFWVDLATGEGLAECFQALGPLDAVLNCAAISQPVACERDPERTRWVTGKSPAGPPRPLPAAEIHTPGLSGQQLSCPCCLPAPAAEPPLRSTAAAPPPQSRQRPRPAAVRAGAPPRAARLRAPAATPVH